MLTEIIERIKKGDEELLVSVYKKFRNEFIQFSVSTYQISDDAAKDVFQDSILIFNENILSGRLTELTSDVKTYLFAIGKYQILNLKRKSVKTSNLYSDSAIKENPFEMAEENKRQTELNEIVKQVMKELPEKDQKILELFYYKDKSLEQIAGELGYANANVVKKKKSLIMKKLGEQVMKLSKHLTSILL